jgi:DNA-binding transcriptional MerR regulator
LQNYNYFRDVNINSVNSIEISNLKKLYYTIGEVAEIFQVNTSLIRFWEKEFKHIQPKKNKKGNRLFTPSDIQNINKIYELVKVKGYTLEGANKVLKSKQTLPIEQESIDQTANVIQRLEIIKLKLLALKEN